MNETRTARNVLGGPLEACCLSPPTGYRRNGYCLTGPEDRASHTVCAQMTAEFLTFSRSLGNDLITPRPEFDFPGLKAGDRWCLCVARWEEAFLAGVAPPVILAATHEQALEVVELNELQAYAATVK
ncbi:MAG: DUF2237 domain-containing protein [Betaproteobacteria bacterium]